MGVKLTSPFSCVKNLTNVNSWKMAAVNFALNAELLYFVLLNILNEVPNIKRAVWCNDFKNLA